VILIARKAAMAKIITGDRLPGFSQAELRGQAAAPYGMTIKFAVFCKETHSARAARFAKRETITKILKGAF